MNFGHFDDANKEYVITTPDTPLPWINYLGSQDFFTLISNTCGGYSFYKDAKLLRITRYRYNNIPVDSNGKYYYIKDGDTVWNPGAMPTRTPLDVYECRHGLGYSRFHGEKNGLAADLLAFVPVDTACEINKLTLRNNSDKVKEISLFSYVEFCLWNAVDDMTNYQRNLSTGEVEIIGSTIYHKTEYRERRNHYSFFTVNTPVDGFDTSRDEFLGLGRGNNAPIVVEEGKSHNSVASGWYPIASQQINVSLAPGEEKEYVFLLGYCENPKDDKWEALNVIKKEPAKKIMEKFETSEQVNEAFAILNTYWDDLLSRYHVESKDPHVNRMANIWNQYQCMVTFNMSRSASYYESGTGRGMGFRDSCQDLLGFVHLIPERARERILDIAATQFEDGSAYHQYQPLTKQGNLDIGSGFNDDPLWLIAAVAAYLKETGDYSILDEMVAFDCHMEKAAPLFEHLRRSFEYSRTHLGPHKLPLIGRADWSANMSGDGVDSNAALAYMGCPWFVYWSLSDAWKGNTILVPTQTKCYWGGTGLAATTDCADTELAAKIMKFFTCDEDGMVAINALNSDYVNNTAAVSKIIEAGTSADGNGYLYPDAGQNFMEFFLPLADGLDASMVTAEDQQILSLMDTQTKAYATGEKDLDTALADLTASIHDTFSYLSAE